MKLGLVTFCCTPLNCDDPRIVGGSEDYRDLSHRW